MRFRDLMVGGTVLLLLGGCAGNQVTEKADPIEGLWSLQSVECLGNSMTADGKKWNQRLANHQESYAMRYSHNGKAHVYGKSFAEQVDQMNYCEIDEDFDWTDRQLPSVCDLQHATNRHGHATDDLCQDAYRFSAVLCVLAGSNVQGNRLRFKLGDVTQTKSKFIEIKNFLPQLCEDGDPTLIFDRVL
jgi:hypothetical protein